MTLPEIELKPGKEQSVKRFHPWIFSGAIRKINGDVAEGDLVTVYSANGEFLGAGHYQKSSIAVRLLTFDETPVDDSFWISRIKRAIDYRKSLGFGLEPASNVYRLIHGEGDLLPGLVIDRYNSTFVVQMHSAGMYLNREIIYSALKILFGENCSAIYDKSEGTLPFKAGLSPENDYV
ncbi:MAG: class I SAM-dependent rRNA methyltransferase, partial [Bacteroidota bacterium]